MEIWLKTDFILRPLLLEWQNILHEQRTAAEINDIKTLREIGDNEKKVLENITIHLKTIAGEEEAVDQLQKRKEKLGIKKHHVLSGIALFLLIIIVGGLLWSNWRSDIRTPQQEINPTPTAFPTSTSTRTPTQTPTKTPTPLPPSTQMPAVPPTEKPFDFDAEFERLKNEDKFKAAKFIIDNYWLLEQAGKYPYGLFCGMVGEYYSSSGAKKDEGVALLLDSLQYATSRPLTNENEGTCMPAEMVVTCPFGKQIGRLPKEGGNYQRYIDSTLSFIEKYYQDCGYSYNLWQLSLLYTENYKGLISNYIVTGSYIEIGNAWKTDPKAFEPFIDDFVAGMKADFDRNGLPGDSDHLNAYFWFLITLDSSVNNPYNSYENQHGYKPETREWLSKQIDTFFNYLTPEQQAFVRSMNE